MFKKVTKILGVIALTGWMGAANATLIFDFSWDCGVECKVTGEILGLVDNKATQAASGLKITDFTVFSNLDNIDPAGWDVSSSNSSWTITSNTFEVSGGQIVSGMFYASTLIGTELGYDWEEEEWAISRRLQVNGFSIEGDFKVESFVNRVTVPEPSAVILILLGLAGLSFARYRKQY
jgi:hypothetical protein